MAISASQLNGNTVPMDSSGDQGTGGRIANLNFAVSNPRCSQRRLPDHHL
jgi:hypothetical protein